MSKTRRLFTIACPLILLGAALAAATGFFTDWSAFTRGAEALMDWLASL